MASQPSRPIKLYRFPLSGHAHRVELFLSLLDLPRELIDVDLRAGAQKSPEFLKLNPFGQVPVIDDDGFVLADSNAILLYLAETYGNGRYLPGDPRGMAEMQRWLSVAAGPIAYGAALARVILLFGAKLDLEQAQATAHTLFRVLDTHLAGRRFLVEDRPTIADIACYSYTAHAPEGGVPLDPYRNISAWLARIEALPGFVSMPRNKVGRAA